MRISSADDPQFNALLRIYSQALPPSECKSEDALRRMIAQPEYIFLAAVDDSTVVGFSICTTLLDSDAALLEYIAIDAARRGSGLGADLFRATASQPQLHGRPLLIEVDAEVTHGADPELLTRRKAFYCRLGCRQIEGLTYRMPPVSSARPPLMDLFVYGDKLPGSITKPRLRAWLTSCYTQVYGMSESDPRINTMLNHMPETIRLI
ncbi:GNAT family N-acetyltransferase [Occallatibacter riparius]|uniref:GNAT family N-acetyltransferase n=1 Tax=Occallatibacter riparius TaxID=1002689 RepID=A0A9J7BVM9_9BACT|nr:GNAT family N-acetyltransferase [Occallatibacter riparius]UWZ86751.1 GNAT family N-acetyltransferase [Occallatibacter riparius]